MGKDQRDREHSRDAFLALRLEFIRLHEPISVLRETQLVPADDVINPGDKCASEAVSAGKKRIVTEKETSGRGDRRQPATASVTIEPTNLTATVSLFSDVDFQIDAPDAERVSLVCMEGEGAEPEAVPMDRLDGHLFRASVALEGGQHLCTFKVDGCARPDVSQAQLLYVRSDYVWSPLKVSHQRQQLALANHGESVKEIYLKPSEKWIVLDQSRLKLEGGESITTPVSFDLRNMKPGRNEGTVKVLTGDEETATPVAVVNVAVSLDARGAVPEVSFEPSDLGAIRQGIDPVELRVWVNARGKGPLTGMISSPESSELVDFRLDADDATRWQFEHTFQIDSSFLPKPQPGQSEAKLCLIVVTDSFLANRRLCRLKVPYRLVYLRKSLPALSFGSVSAGGSKTLRLDVASSDGREIDLAVKVPPEAGGYLEAYQARANAYVFRFNPGSLPMGTTVKDTIELVDQKSGLRDRIKMLATVTSRDRDSSRGAGRPVVS